VPTRALRPPAAASRFDAQRAFRDLRSQVAIGPRPSGSAGAGREVRLIVERLRAAGVRDVTIQRPYRNVVARIPGRLPGDVVVGAHYDTKDIPGFVGANDGASGVAVVLELARDLPPRLEGPSIDLVLFDAEAMPAEDHAIAAGARAERFIQNPLQIAAVAIFVVNIVRALRSGPLAGADPWDAWTLEWATTSPPPAYNFEVVPVVASRRPLWDLKHPDDPDGPHE
jgi:hypothetical protein